MYDIQKCFKSKKIINHLYSLINDYGYKSYYSLSHSDKCQFASLLIEASNDQECLIENSEDILALIKKSLSDSDDMDIMFDIKSIIMKYYENTMWHLFNEIQEEIIRERRAA